MKIVFTICFLIFSGSGSAHTIITGSGSGSILQNDMRGLKPGDTLALRSGFYEKGGSFLNLAGITIINYQGLVNFGNTVVLGNLNKVIISGSGWAGGMFGIHFENFSGDAFLLQSPCRFLIIDHCEYWHLNGAAFNASRFFTTYNGDSSTFALYKTSFCNQKLVNSGPLFIGSWTANALFQNVVDSIAFQYIIIDSTIGDGCQVIGHSIYRMLASHWRITGPCPNGKHDIGIFLTSGNGTVCNIYRKGGWGYIWRSWNLALNGRANSFLFNCIDLSSDNYGTIDTRMDAEDTTTGTRIPFLRGASMHVLNNTIGNKRTPNYVSQIVIAGNYCYTSGYTLEVRNNLCFNTVATGFDQIIKQNTKDPIPDTSNNIYSRDPIADGILLDTVDCKLNPSGAAVNAAITYPFIPTDIDGVRRPIGRSSDIGAREYPLVVTRPVTNQGGSRFPKKWQILKVFGLLITIFMLVFIKRARRRDETILFKVQ
jgi:hypothetical protein